MMCNLALQNAQFDFHLVRIKYLARDKYAFADEIRHKPVSGLMVQVICGIPLLDLALMHHANLDRRWQKPLPGRASPR